MQRELKRGLTLFQEDLVRFRERLLRWARSGGDRKGVAKDGGRAAAGDDETVPVSIENDEVVHNNAEEPPAEARQTYRPRSVTGQAVAERFSTVRGTVTRTLDMTLLNVREAIRTAANVLVSVAVKFVPGLPAADEGRIGSGWRLLSSLRWQAPPELLGRTGDLRNSVKSVISKARLQRLDFVKNRAKQDKILRMLGSSATSASSLFSGVRDAMIGMVNLYRGTSDAGGGKRISGNEVRTNPKRKSLAVSNLTLQSKLKGGPLYKPSKTVGLERVVRAVQKEKVGKKSGVLVAAGVMTAVGGLIGGGLSIGTVVSCTAIVATSAVMVSGRIDSITPPSRRNRRVYVNPLDERQTRKNYVARSRSGLARGPQMRKNVLKERREDIEQKQEAWIIEERMEEVQGGRWGAEESLETTAYSVGPAKPWLISVPLFGDMLKILDSTAFTLERGWRSLLRTLGIPMKNSRVEGGWVILDALQRNRYGDSSSN